jgi:hypothetical protein
MSVLCLYFILSINKIEIDMELALIIVSGLFPATNISTV